MKLWPRTLGVQLIVVTAVAVFLSNAAVALWFEWGNERHNEKNIVERIFDRATAVTMLMSSIPPKARIAAANTMTNWHWRYKIRKGHFTPEAMTAEEANLAARLKAMLPPKYAKQSVTVHFRKWHDRRHHAPGPPREGMEMNLPVVRNTRLVVTVVRPHRPPWPTELTVAAIVSIVVASAAGAYIARRVARPLSKLADAASVAAGGETAPHVPEVGPDDVRNAAQAFNAMTDQVTRTLESQRQLLSAVGHDLRTPITAMRINLEFVEETELRERLLKNLDELQDLTEAVLSAARGTGGEAARQIDLSSLVESICADLDDLGEPVVWNGYKPAPLRCRANEVRRAIRNLVENAVAYGQKAEVSIREVPRFYEVVVDDNGPGIALQDRARVFEPFVRLEGSRNEETGGTGLGLTQVKTIAEGHGGKIVLEDRPGGGLRARLSLPRQAAPRSAKAPA